MQELQTQVQQGTRLISQGQQLYDDFNKLTNVNSLAGVLNNPALRRYLPAEVQDTSRLLNGTLSDLGSIGTRATSIRDATQSIRPVGGNSGDRAQRRKSAIVARPSGIAHCSSTRTVATMEAPSEKTTGTVLLYIARRGGSSRAAAGRRRVPAGWAILRHGSTRRDT